MLAEAFHFLIDTVGTLLIVVVLLRFWMQALRSPFNNPLARFVIAATDWGVRPLRRVVPGFWGHDLASLMLAWLLAWALLVLLELIHPNGVGYGAEVGANVVMLAIYAFVHLLRLSIYLLMVALILQVVLSWINPASPVAPLVQALTRPFVRPLQRWIKPVGGVDLTPLVALILCQLALMVPVRMLERLVLGA
jgi:YggT family protein